jgi:hypothetical protein
VRKRCEEGLKRFWWSLSKEIGFNVTLFILLIIDKGGNVETIEFNEHGFGNMLSLHRAQCLGVFVMKLWTSIGANWKRWIWLKQGFEVAQGGWTTVSQTAFRVMIARLSLYLAWVESKEKWSLIIWLTRDSYIFDQSKFFSILSWQNCWPLKTNIQENPAT